MGNPASSESFEEMAKAMEQEEAVPVTTPEVVEPKVYTIGVEEIINPE